MKDAHYQGAAKLGHGNDYVFPHDFPQDWVPQQYLPDRIKNAEYFHSKKNGRFETAFGQRYWQLRNTQQQALRGHHHPQNR